MSANGTPPPGPQPLTTGEVLGLIGDKEVELAMQRRYIAQLEARLAEYEPTPAEDGRPTGKPAETPGR